MVAVWALTTVPLKQVAYRPCAEQGGLSAHAQVAVRLTLLLKDGSCYDNTDGQGFQSLIAIGLIFKQLK